MTRKLAVVIELLPWFCSDVRGLSCCSTDPAADTEKKLGHDRFRNLFTPRNRDLLEKLTGFHLVKKFPAFYGTRRFITAFTSAPPPPVPILSQLDPVHNSTSYSLKIQLNIILPSTPRSTKWSLPQVSTPKSCLRSFLSHTRYFTRPTYYSRFYRPNNIW
jgi:hypothetical protein